LRISVTDRIAGPRCAVCWSLCRGDGIVTRLESAGAAARGAESGAAAINCGKKMAGAALTPGPARRLRYIRPIALASVTASK
jgi:hypothetical protein